MAQNPRSIQILREYQNYYFENACTHKVEHKVTMFIPSETRLFFIPFQKFLPNLELSLMDGKTSPIIPYTELHNIIDRPDKPFTVEEIQQLAAETFGVSLDIMKKFSNFAIVIFPEHVDHYNEITIKWIEPLETPKKSTDKITLFSLFTVTTIPTDDASLYVSFKVNEKYEILDKPTIAKFENENYGIENEHTTKNLKSFDIKEYTILDDKKHHVLHFPREFSDEIKIEYRVGVPKLFLMWIWVGFFIGALIVGYNVFFSDDFYHSLALAFGITGVLIGFRIVLFHDIELLSRWNWIYMITIFVNIAALLYLKFKI